MQKRREIGEWSGASAADVGKLVSKPDFERK
jgi:hypothetical protein